MSHSSSMELRGKPAAAVPEDNQKYGLTPALERFYTSKAYAINFCIFLHTRDMYNIFITVDQASEIAIIMAEYFAKRSASSRSQHEMDVDNAAQEGKPVDLITDSKTDRYTSSDIENMKAVLAEKGYHRNTQETADLMQSFEDFSRSYAWTGRVMEENKHELIIVTRKRDGKRVVVNKAKWKAAAIELKGKNAVDGRSWAEIYLPPGGFWGCPGYSSGR